MDEQNERNEDQREYTTNKNSKIISSKKRKITEIVVKETLPQYCVVDISGTMVHTDTIYQVIAERLSINLSNCAGPIERTARDKVLSRFRNEQQCSNTSKGSGKEVIPITILMIDEIDKAPLKAICELLEIISHATAESPTTAPASVSMTSSPHPYACSLILIGIANDLTFTCKLGVSFKASEHIQVIPFKPYEIPELQSILNHRSMGLLDSRATYLIAAKGSRSEGGKTNR